MQYCHCIPWDYPTSYEDYDIRICDFYGNSCFNSYIENGMAVDCQKKCDPGCNEIKYTTFTEKEPIKWNDICSHKASDTDKELDLFGIETAEYLNGTFHSGRSGITRFQEALLNSENSTTFRHKYCETKLKNDIALVEVLMDSPTVIKYIQRYKATETDKLANFGTYLCLYIYISGMQ